MEVRTRWARTAASEPMGRRLPARRSIAGPLRVVPRPELGHIRVVVAVARVLAWVLFTSGCATTAPSTGSATELATGTTTSSVTTSAIEGGTATSCDGPADVNSYDAAANVGCRLSAEPSVPMPVDGRPGCGASQFLVYCLGAVSSPNPDGSPALSPASPIPTPPASLNCSTAPANLLDNEAYYCCPCPQRALAWPGGPQRVFPASGGGRR